MAEKKYPREWTKAEAVGVTSGKVIYEKKYFDLGGVARITFNSEVLPGINELTEGVADDVKWAISDAHYDPSIGVVVITSSGDKSFLAGGELPAEAKDRLVKPLALETENFQHAISRCVKPIIAAVKGYCLAAGNHLAYFCDITIAADNAVFGQIGPRVGSPADGNMVAYLTRVVGAKKAREMWMLCRRYNAQQALEMGLVNAVVPVDKLDEEVDKWCQEILALNPTCISIVKASMDSDTNYMRGSIGRQKALIAPGFELSEEAQEAQQAFFEGREPNWWKFRGMPPPKER